MTTILAVRHKEKTAIGGDGQVTHGNSKMKARSVKIRKLLDGTVLTGFAGATADAFALLERFELKLKDHPSNVLRAATELAKDWRTDRALRRLESMMIVAAPKTKLLLLSGTGDVITDEDGILATGSGGDYARAAAIVLTRHSKLSAGSIVRESLKAAAEIDLYTNTNLVIEEFNE